MLTQISDKLKVIVRTTKAVTIIVSGIVKAPNKNPKPFGPKSFTIDGVISGTSILGAVNTLEMLGLLDGEILALNIHTDTASVQPGECFIRAILESGFYTGVTRATLFADYLSTASPLSFPGSPIVSSLSGPGAIASQSVASALIIGTTYGSILTVPANLAYRVKAIITGHLLNAGGADSSIAASFYDSGNQVGLIRIIPGFLASGGAVVTFHLDTQTTISNDASNTYLITAIPDILLMPGSTCTITQDYVATNNNVNFVYDKWIAP